MHHPFIESSALAFSGRRDHGLKEAEMAHDHETTHPAPADLPPEAADVWRAIIADKPAHYFDAGSLPLLEMYCRMHVHIRGLRDAMDDAEQAGDHARVTNLEKRTCTLTSQLATLASKLRLCTNQSIERHSASIGEGGLPTDDDGLIGGSA